MTVSVQIETHGFILDAKEARRVNRQLASLDARIGPGPAARALLVLRQRPDRAGFAAELRVHLGPLGPDLLGRRDASLAVDAAGRAIGAVRRQLARETAERPGGPPHGRAGRSSASP